MTGYPCCMASRRIGGGNWVALWKVSERTSAPKAAPVCSRSLFAGGLEELLEVFAGGKDQQAAARAELSDD